jgi:release factor glutamine methyltransferase
MDAGITIGAWLRNAQLPSLEARILLTHALGLTRVQLITQSERTLTGLETDQLAMLAQRRIDGEPIAYIVGTREFYGLEFEVTPAVLIPRPETELLVELALDHLPEGGGVLDMGTGSGAIAVAIARNCPDAQVTALDVSAAALAIAQRNATKHDAKVEFLRSDWYSAVGDRQFNVIVSNPPYIVKDDHHLREGDLRFEPVDALTDHDDGLSALRTIIAGAARHLNGWLFMEHGYDQAEAVRTLLQQQRFADVQSWKDLAGIERVTGGNIGLPAQQQA